MLKGAYPISGEDLMALPVRAIGPAVAFYRDVLGFDVVSADESAAVLRRDSARIGLARMPGHRPERAGSFALGVTGIEAHHRELEGRGLDLGGVRIEERGGRAFRVFFLREAGDGYGFCFSEPVETNPGPAGAGA